MSEQTRPHVVVIGGPNGAGKSTSAATILPVLGIRHFVNADVIARGLSAFDPESVAVAAGRVMIERLDELERQRESFAFETTLSSRTVQTRLRRLLNAGYAVDLIYVWISSGEAAVDRVAGRVRSGGHHVPDEDVKRRYKRSLSNFFQLYRPLATHWRMYDNSHPSGPRLIAFADAGSETKILDEPLWGRILQEHGHGTIPND